MTRPIILFPIAVAVVFHGWASAPPRRPAHVDMDAGGDTAYLALTRYQGCEWRGDEWLPASRSAVVRYYAPSTDSVRYPFRIITGPSTGLCWPIALAVGPNRELFVLNQAPPTQPKDSIGARWERWVTVYDSSASGDVAPIRVLHIPSNWFGNPTTMQVDRDGTVYLGSRVTGVIDEGSVAVFEPGADGDVPPARIIAGPSTGLYWPAPLAVDRRGFVYVVNSQADPRMPRGMARRLASFTQIPGSHPLRGSTWARALEPFAIRVFAPGAAGDVPPSRVISGEQTGLSDPVGLALDRKDRLYVANTTSVTMYLPSAAGDAAPARRFTDSRVYGRMGEPRGVLLDSHDSLFVRSGGGALGGPRILTVFAPSDSIASSRAFMRNAPAMFAFDRHDTLYTLAGDSVKVFSPGYAGGASPVRSISGPQTGIRSVTAMALDRDGKLYLTVGDSAIVRVYDHGASGDAAPVRTIAGPHTRLTRPGGIAVDGNGRVYVTNGERRSGGGGAIRVLAAGAQGEDQPVRTLVGPDVPLPPPSDIALDSKGDLYLVAADEKTGGQVLVLRKRGERPDSVVRRLAGPSTLLRDPVALAVGPGDTVYALNVFGAFATVTVYPPAAGDNTEPVRVIDVRPKGQTPWRAPLGAPRDVAVDTTGSVQVWTTDVAAVYRPGATGDAKPARVTPLKAVEGDRGAVTVAGDGTVYQAISPSRGVAGLPGMPCCIMPPSP